MLSVLGNMGGELGLEGGSDAPYVVVHVTHILERERRRDDAPHAPVFWSGGRGSDVRLVVRESERFTGLPFDPYEALANDPLDERREDRRVWVVERVLRGSVRR